jgi:hypothetical protein
VDRVPSWTVESDWKATPDEAVQDALEKAKKDIGPYLKQLSPPVLWMPSSEFIRQHLVKDLRKDEPGFRAGGGGEVDEFRVANRLAKIEVKDFDNQVGLMHRVALRIEVTPQDRREIEREDVKYQAGLRQVRAHERQALLAKALAGVVAVLAAVAGYLRLEDATKGYYTAILRLCAVAFVTAVVLVVFVLV